MGYNQVFNKESSYSEFGLIFDVSPLIHLGFKTSIKDTIAYRLSMSFIPFFKRIITSGEVENRGDSLIFNAGAMLNPFDGLFISSGIENNDKFYFGAGIVPFNNFAISYKYDGTHSLSFLFSMPYYKPLIKKKHHRVLLHVKDYKERRDFSFFIRKKNSFFDLVYGLENKGRDIRTLYVKLTDEDLSYAQAEELRNSLKRLRERGVKIVVYSRFYDLKKLYIASVADSVIMHPLGRVYLFTPYATLFFFKEFMEKAGIQIDYSRIGEYKSAVEPFIQDSASSFNKEQIKDYLNDVKDVLIEGIVNGRGIMRKSLEELIEKEYILNHEEAVEKGLIDRYYYLQEKGFVRFRKIQSDTFLSIPHNEKGIGLIVIEGTITQGKSRRGGFPLGIEVTGSSSIRKLLKKLEKDSRIKGLVIRINSPGGSALASDDIWIYIKEFSKKKPVYISFGESAASGGYYVASAGDTIISDRMTLTGSIGIFGMKFVYKGLLDKMGIGVEHVKVDKHSDMFSPFRKMSRDEFDLFSQEIREGYKLFLERVGEGRGMNLEEVDSVGKGRIWSGLSAKEKRLVDQYGGIMDCITLLKKRCKLPKDAPVYYFSDIEFSFFNMDILNLFKTERIFFIMPYYISVE